MLIPATASVLWTPATYTRRQKIALESAEERDAINWMATNNPHTRQVTVVRVSKETKLQLVSILTVDLDSPPVWHARVGYLEPTGEYGDRFVPLARWKDELEQAAKREMAALTKFPPTRPEGRFVFGKRGDSPKNPSTWHCMIPLTANERDYMQVVSMGAVRPLVRLRQARKRVWNA